MSESLLLWLRGACTVLQLLSFCGFFGGAACLCVGCTKPEDPRAVRAGMWLVAVSIVLLVVLPWPDLWEHWLEMARRP